MWSLAEVSTLRDIGASFDASSDKKEIWERLCEKAGEPEMKDTFDIGTWPMQNWPFRRLWSAVRKCEQEEGLRLDWTDQHLRVTREDIGEYVRVRLLAMIAMRNYVGRCSRIILYDES
jgi:hypothetical protein